MARVSKAQDIRSNALDKDSERAKRSKVYSTEKIKQIMDDISHGSDPDMNPFWHGQPQYRDAGVAFEYTDEELEELDKCSNDCMYFVKNYCKFKNDKGVTLVKLRDYQERLLTLLGSEKWDEQSETVIPMNPKIVLMQSRQTGKCVDLDTECVIDNNSYNKILQNIKNKYGIIKIFKKMLKIFI